MYLLMLVCIVIFIGAAVGFLIGKKCSYNEELKKCNSEIVSKLNEIKTIDVCIYNILVNRSDDRK